MDVSSVISSASAMQQAKVRTQVDTAIAAKTMQTQRDQGEAMVELIAQAAQVQQQGLDIKA